MLNWRPVVDLEIRAIERVKQIARATLTLVGLDRRSQDIADANGRLIAIDRVKQRKSARLVAKRAKERLSSNPAAEVSDAVILLAQATGIFSIWMEVFRDNPAIRNRLIDAFPGTRDSGCFDLQSFDLVQPAPNPDNLPDGGKA
jgi:hypothetical protein